MLVGRWIVTCQMIWQMTRIYNGNVANCMLNGYPPLTHFSPATWGRYCSASPPLEMHWRRSYFESQKNGNVSEVLNVFMLRGFCIVPSLNVTCHFLINAMLPVIRERYERRAPGEKTRNLKSGGKTIFSILLTRVDDEPEAVWPPSALSFVFPLFMLSARVSDHFNNINK